MACPSATITDVVGLRAGRSSTPPRTGRTPCSRRCPATASASSTSTSSPSEGGLNLAMGKQTIGVLVGFGGRAGESARPGARRRSRTKHLSMFEDHRWRRFLVAFARLEETLARAAEVWGDVASAEGFGAFVKTQACQSALVRRVYPRMAASGVRALRRLDALRSRLGARSRFAPTRTANPAPADRHAHHAEAVSGGLTAAPVPPPSPSSGAG